MVKFQEAQVRLFRNKFVCRRCKTVIKAPNVYVIQGKVKCKNCKSSALRPIKRK